MIRSIGGRSEELSILSGFDRTFYDAFKNAFERGQKEAWQQIIYFIQKGLIKSFGKDSGVVMQQLNWLPSAIYILSSSNLEASTTVAKEFGSFFKAASWIFTSEYESEDPINGHPLRFNMFFKILMDFYHYSVHHPDETVVKELINNFKSIAGREYDFDTRFEIQKLNNASQQEKKALRDSVTQKHILLVTQRRATLALVAWLTFLFLMEKLSKERFSFLLKQFDLRYDFFEEMLYDIDYIRSNERLGYLGIGSWDYIERESGVLYSPPTAYDWILYGAALILLRGPLPHFDESVIVDDDEHAFLFDAMKQKLQSFKFNLDKLSSILGWDNAISVEEGQTREEILQEYFHEGEKPILDMFQKIKTLNEEEGNRQLAVRPLDQQRIKSFLEILYQKWLANCTSYQLFRDQGTFEPVTSVDGLDFHGQSVLLEHQRTMFAEGQQQTIYGSDDLGAIIGRNVDEHFINDIIRLTPQKPAATVEGFDSVTTGLDACISALRVAEIEPDMIIVPPSYLYKSDLVKSGKYKRINSTERLLQIGTYDGIPVIRMFAQRLNEKAIVMSFKKALSLSLFENRLLFEGILHLTLRELTDNELEEELEGENAKWTTNSDGVKLTEKQARLRLATTMMLEMWTRGKFNVINPKAITWCKFMASASILE